MSDITHRLAAESDRRELEEQLAQAQKMEAIGQLAGGIAHDFNNHLHAIKTFAELALSSSDFADARVEFLPAVINSADQATTLVGQLLAFSRQQILELRVIDLDEEVRKTIKMLSRLIGENIDIHWEQLAGQKFVTADATQIGQILTNLCLNARDAITGFGSIVVQTELVEFDAQFCEINQWAAPGEFVKMQVKDSGSGIDKATQKKIFEPFFTTKPTGKGTGIGLSTVYGIVHQHKGFVHVESEVGVGSIFDIYFPVERAQVKPETDRQSSVRFGTGELILLVEDEDLVRRANTELLEKAGYSVLAAVDGEEALRVFAENQNEIDLAILDVVMPKLGGKAVGERITSVRPGLPILFTSGYSLSAIDSSLVTNENIQLIQKPFRSIDLIDKIRQMLGSKTEKTKL